MVTAVQSCEYIKPPLNCTYTLKLRGGGVPVMAQWLMNLTSIMRIWVQSLASPHWVRKPALLWLWCRLAVTALIRPLAWEPPYAEGAALEKRQK